MRVAACTSRGKPKGEPIHGVARVVDEEPLVRRLQAEKYGWQKRLIETANRVVRAVTRRSAEQAVFLEITPVGKAGDETHVRAA